MNDKEKNKIIMGTLLNGGVIYRYPGQCRVLDAKRNPVLRITVTKFFKIKDLLRLDKRANGYVADRREIRKLSRHHWVKKEIELQIKNRTGYAN